DRVEHAPLAVPEQPGRVVAEEVDVLAPVCVDEDRALAADERQGERLVREDRARVTAREVPTGLVVQPLALRVPRGGRFPLFGNQRSEVREDGRAPTPIVPERR